MLTISTREQLERFQQRRALVSLFVDHAYVKENVDFVLDMKDGFDHHVGSAWDMLIPYQNSYAINAKLSSKAFGTELSRAIIKEYGIAHDDLPALIFEFVPGAEYYCVKLGRLSREKILSIIGNIADMAVDEFENGPKDVNDFRQRLHDRIVIYLRQQKVLSLLGKAAPKIIALLGAGSDLAGLFD